MSEIIPDPAASVVTPMETPDEVEPPERIMRPWPRHPHRRVPGWHRREPRIALVGSN